MNLAQLIDAIPVVQSTADRGSKFAAPQPDQRVFNKQTSAVERWNVGTGTWVPDIPGFDATGVMTMQPALGILFPSVAGATPFGIQSGGGATFNGQRDDVFYFASYNIVPGTIINKITPSEPAIHFHLENHYFDGVEHWIEMNFDYLSGDNLTVLRALALQINRRSGGGGGSGWSLVCAPDGSGRTGQFNIESPVNSGDFSFRIPLGVSTRQCIFRYAGGSNELLQIGNDGTAIAPDEIQIGPSTTVSTDLRIIKNGQTIFGHGTATPIVIAAYSASIFFDSKTSNDFVVIPTNGTAFSLNAPYNSALLTAGIVQRVRIRIKNTFGVLGAATFVGGAGGFRIGAAWVQPANGFSRFIEFAYDQAASVWIETWRSAADVAN